MDNIVLIGAGGHAISCIEIIERNGQFRIVGLVGRKEELHKRICGYEVIATDDDLPKLAEKYQYALITLGQVKSPKGRIDLFNKARVAGFKLPVIISSSAHVSQNAHIGEGSIIMNGAIVNAAAQIGSNCIINSRALIEHGTKVGDCCHISTGAIVNGDVRVGDATFIASGSLVKHSVTIGARCVVGMGSIVQRDLPDDAIFSSQYANSKVLIIAEAGVNHNGDMQLAKKLIDIAADAGADIVKFQTFCADRLVIKSAMKADYQIETSGNLESQHEMLHRLELTSEMHDELISYAVQRNIEFMSTAFDEESLDMLANKGMKRFKVPSGEITNLAYLRRIATVAEEVIISTGMATLREISDALLVLEAAGVSRNSMTILHCTTEYPAPLADVNLRAMQTIAREFGIRVGYSDHTQGIEVPIAAVAMGAVVIEKHFTLDQSLPGPDHKASLPAQHLATMVKYIRNIELAIGDGIKKPSVAEVKNLSAVRKSLVAIQPIKAGEPFTSHNIGAKRPGTGISPMRLDEVIGRVALRNFAVDELIEL